jgi:ABC-2 type transport system ATP-binding protein
MNPHPVIALDRLTQVYPGDVGIRGVSLVVDHPELVVVVGPNGCGKTTTIEGALGLRKLSSGRARLCGLDPIADQRALARMIGVQLQRAALHSRVSLREHAQQVDACYGTPGAFVAVAEELGLWPFLRQTYGTLSGGQQRRALVAGAIAAAQRLCILDEPTSGADIESSHAIWNALRTRVEERELCVLMTTHDLAEAERFADRLVVMQAGRVIADGSATSILARSGLGLVVDVHVDDPDVVLQLCDTFAGRELSRVGREISVGFERADVRSEIDDWARGRGLRAELRGPRLQDAYLQLSRAEEVAA